MLLFIRYLFDILVDKIFGFIYRNKANSVASVQSSIQLDSGVSLAKKIRNKELTSEEVVKSFISRIKEVNFLINAVVDDRFEEALKEAREIDKTIANGSANFENKPFLGVPFTTKESTACKGLSNTFGLLCRRSKKGEFDAHVVQSVKNAGGILLGVTNVPQLNLWQETNCPVYRCTNNPYNTTRNVGGSSGGEASLIAACGSPIGIGTDIGGSLRIPAFMCGIFAHKPSSSLISTHGLTFRTGKEQGTMVVAGPMSKSAEDLAPLLKVLLDEKVTSLKLDEAVALKDLKVYYLINPNDPFVSPFRKEMNEILMRVVHHFEEYGQPQEINVPELKYGGKLWRYWMTQEPNANFNLDITDRKKQIGSVKELVKFVFRQSEYNLAVMFNLINGLLPKEKSEWAVNTTNVLREKLLNYLGTDGVLIYPSAPWPASYHYTAFLRPWNLNLFSVWNVLKFPVTQVPLGLGKDGLPLGLQIVAAPFQDHLTIAVAKELERVFGGFVPPFSA